jgi:hypothetical protein
MPFISFIYRIGSNKKTYYGKYVTDYISDDHEGLDEEVKYTLLEGINKYREQRNLKKINSKDLMVGVMSLCLDDNIPSHSSKQEIKCFDFYYDNDFYSDNRYKTYINGKELV